MANILRFFTEFGSFRGQLHKSGWLTINRFSPKECHKVHQLSTMDALCSLRQQSFLLRCCANKLSLWDRDAQMDSLKAECLRHHSNGGVGIKTIHNTTRQTSNSFCRKTACSSSQAHARLSWCSSHTTQPSNLNTSQHHSVTTQQIQQQLIRCLFENLQTRIN